MLYPTKHYLATKHPKLRFPETKKTKKPTKIPKQKHKKKKKKCVILHAAVATFKVSLAIPGPTLHKRWAHPRNVT